jgi:Tfp pilus assembly protein PilF
MGDKMKKRIIHKGIRALIVTVVFLVFLTGCSTTQSMFGLLPFSDHSNMKGGLSNKDIAGFGVSIRPARGNPDSHYLLAKYYQERGRHKEAIEELEKTISIDPAYVKAYNRIGISYDKLGNFSRAVAYYQNALALNSELDYVMNNLGYSYILQGKYDEAVKSLQKAVDLNSRNKQYHNNLGLAYTKNDKYEQAMTEFRLAGNRKAAQYNLNRVIYEKTFGPVAENYSTKDSHVETYFETLISRIDSTKTIPETADYRESKQVPSLIKKNKRLVFGKPIYGPGLIQEKERIVFGKPVYGPGLKSKKEHAASKRQTFGYYVKKLYRWITGGSSKA